MFINALRFVGRFTAKCIIFFALCAFIYAIVSFFSDNWKEWIMPIFYSLWSFIGWTILGKISKVPEKIGEKTEDFIDTALNISDVADVGKLIVEWLDMTKDVIVDVTSTVSDVASAVSDLDIPS